MTSGGLVAFSAVLEPWAAIAAGAALLVLAVRRVLRGAGPPGASLDAPIPVSRERRLLAVLVVVALCLRLVGWDAALTPTWWFSEVSVLHVDKMLRDGSLWAVWNRQLASTRIDVAHQATAVLPLLAGLQALLGPRFGLSVVAGALVGALVVVLAWAFGREVRSQAFGLLFAALVAFSPLQLMWSRLSPMCTEAVAHVLAALLVGWLAGRRGSLPLALLTGVIAWTSLQQYYAARAALPVAVVGIVAGALRSWRGPRGVLLVCVAALAFGLAHRAVHGDAAVQGVWPTYRGYLGNKGERSLVDLVEQNAGPVVHEARTSIVRYLAQRRTGLDSDVRKPGIAEGGLASPAAGVLGLVGLVAVLRRFRRQWPWLVLAAIGLALPSLSAASARRMLLFDVAWCGLAAHGLLAAADGLGRRASYAARAGGVAATVVVLALWSTVAVFGLSAAMPADYAKHIPFGDAGFGDGVACRRCVEAARGWERDVANGAFVVLFDNDAFRENRTSPGGLPAYGKIAALAAGRPRAFVEGYGLMAAWDPEPPTPGMTFDRTASTFVDELESRMDAVAPRRIVWHFERPTAWERWLAGRLQAAGAVRETFATPLGPGDGIRLLMSVARRPQAMAVLRDAAGGLPPGATSCFTLDDAGASPSPGVVFLLGAPAVGDAQGPPRWIVASWQHHRYGAHELSTSTTPVGARVSGPEGAERVELLCEDGDTTVIDVPSLRRSDAPSNVPGRSFGLGCGAWAAGHWWLVESFTGRVVSLHPAVTAVPPGAWIGVAAGPSGQLVLASATQEILLFDPARPAVIARFPARVPPTVRVGVDECTPIAVGSGWIAVANLRTAVMAAYSFSGRALGAQRLDRLDAGRWPSTIGGAGRYLGVASEAGVRTFEVTLDPACAVDAAPSQP
jgi:hypothetical protein